jgi:hypothetical protein
MALFDIFGVCYDVFNIVKLQVHVDLPNTTLVAIEVHVILRRYIVLTWMFDDRKLV